MQLRPRKTYAKRKALSADANVDQDSNNNAMRGDFAAANQEVKTHTLITAKGEGEENKTPSDDAAIVEEDHALQQDLASDNEDAEDECNAKSEEQDVKEQLELLYLASRRQENQQLAAFPYEMAQDQGMAAELDGDSACIKGEEDEMDVDEPGEADELDTNTNDAMDIEEATGNASSTVNDNTENDAVLHAPTKDNTRIVICQNANEVGSAYKAPELPAFRDHSLVQDAEEGQELTIKKEATKLNIPPAFVSGK